MEYTVADIFDRLSILELKIKRIENSGMEEEHQQYKNEFSDLMSEYKEYLVPHLSFLFEAIFYVNKQIWDLENDIRNEREKELGLEEVGRRAIKIREWNKKRIKIKNLINYLTNSGFQEIKSTEAKEP